MRSAGLARGASVALVVMFAETSTGQSLSNGLAALLTSDPFSASVSVAQKNATDTITIFAGAAIPNGVAIFPTPPGLITRSVGHSIANGVASFPTPSGNAPLRPAGLPVANGLAIFPSPVGPVLQVGPPITNGVAIFPSLPGQVVMRNAGPSVPNGTAVFPTP